MQVERKVGGEDSGKVGREVNTCGRIQQVGKNRNVVEAGGEIGKWM